MTARSAFTEMTWPSRSYLLGVAASLATAWVVIALVAGLIRNQFVYRLVAIFAWTIAALNNPRFGAADKGGAQFSRHRDRGPARVAAAGDQDDGAAAADAVGGERGQRLPRKTRARHRRPDAVDPGADRQADANGADHLRDPDRALDRRYRLFGAGVLLRRGRRRPRLRPAEDRVQPGERHHPARRQVDQTGRRDHGRQLVRLGLLDGRALYVGGHPRRPRIPDPERGFRHPARGQLVVFQRRSPTRRGIRRRPTRPIRTRCANVRVEASQIGRACADLAAAGLSSQGLRRTPRSISSCDSGFAIRSTARTNVRGKVLLALWDIFKREGIEIPFPQRDVNMRGPVHIVEQKKS